MVMRRKRANDRISILDLGEDMVKGKININLQARVWPFIIIKRNP